jgi:hypothetical protein
VSISAFILSLFGKSAKAQVPAAVQEKIDAGMAAILNDPEFRKRQANLERSLSEDRFDLFVADKPLAGDVVAEVHLTPDHRHTLVVWEGYQKQAVYTMGQGIGRSYIMQHQPVSNVVLQVHPDGRVTLPGGELHGLIGKMGADSSAVSKRIEKALKTTSHETHSEFGGGRLLAAEKLSAK